MSADIMKNLDRLFGWFDRSRDAESGVPSYVTREDLRKARLYLQEHSGFDFEEFEKDIQVEKLLNTPLGDTAECLSADEIAILVGSDASVGMINPYLIDRAIRHSEVCDTCFDNIALYQELKNKSIERAIGKNVEDLAPLLSIDAVGRVRAAANVGPYLGLAVTCYGAASDFREMDTLHAQIVGPFDEKDVTLHRVEPSDKAQSSGGFFHMRSSSAARSFHGYYCTNALTGLGQLRDNACTFVSISQDIGGKKVLSRRVVRLERDPTS